MEEEKQSHPIVEPINTKRTSMNMPPQQPRLQSNQWSVQQTPVLSAITPFRGSSAAPSFNLQQLKTISSENESPPLVPAASMNKQWSVQESVVSATNLQKVSSIGSIESAYENTKSNVYHSSDNDSVHSELQISSYLGVGVDKINDDDGYASSVASSSDYGSSQREASYTESEIDRIIDENVLEKYGYELVSIVSTTTHGCVYKAKVVEVNNAEITDHVYKSQNIVSLNGHRKISKNSGVSGQSEYVAIKKVDKKIYELNQKGKNEDPPENIVKEAIIMHYLSVMNKPPADNMTQFIDFIESDSDYYLIQTYCGQTLRQFIQTAHQYIAEKKMKLKHWRITVKFLFWQIAVMVHWMHHDMRVCHLDLTTDNILVSNGVFLLSKKDGSITVDAKNLTIKLADFGFSELFPWTANNDDEKEHLFECAKKGITKEHHYKCPARIDGLSFDGRKSDCYSLGVVLYEMFTGSKPYSIPNGDEDKGYLALQTKELQNYLKNNGLSKHIVAKTLSLVEGLLNIDEEERFDTLQILSHDWFQHYYLRYKSRIEQKTKSQYVRHQRQAKKMKILPYYVLPNKHCVL